jgi:hypothetical protein
MLIAMYQFLITLHFGVIRTHDIQFRQPRQWQLRNADRATLLFFALAGFDLTTPSIDLLGGRQGSTSGLPDFSWYNIPKQKKYTKGPHNVPNGHKITNWPQNMPTSSITGPSKIYPNWDFWYENIPSGNPARHTYVFLTLGKSTSDRQLRLGTCGRCSKMSPRTRNLPNLLPSSLRYNI